VTRGAVAFKVSKNASDLKLVIPFTAGPTKLDVPENVFYERSNRQDMVKKSPVIKKANNAPDENPSNVNDMFSGNIFGALAQGGNSQSANTVEENTLIVTDNSGIESNLMPNSLEGFPHVMKIVRDSDGVTIVIGSVGSADELEQIINFISDDPLAENYVYVNTTADMRPRTVRIQTDEALKAAGLNGIIVKSRKKGELVLMGTVVSKTEEELALSIAKIQPGIKDVVNKIQY